MQVDYGDEPDSDHSLHLTAHYEHAGNSGNPAFSPFRHPSAGVPAIDPGLEQSTSANRNGHAPMSVVPHTANNHLLQPDDASLSSAHLAHGFYAEMARSSQPPSTPSNASPRFSAAVTPSSQAKHAAPSYTPDDRSLPSQDVSDDSIDSAFASFILYCNPSFALSTDTTELVKLFRIPPKSDGNTFSTWSLFELIGKFSTGEIKTWTQLALDLGVSPPDTDKGQSTQKVQQYSVRLKVRNIYVHPFHSIACHFMSLQSHSRRTASAYWVLYAGPFAFESVHEWNYASQSCGAVDAPLWFPTRWRALSKFSLDQATSQEGARHRCMDLLDEAAVARVLALNELVVRDVSYLAC